MGIPAALLLASLLILLLILLAIRGAASARELSLGSDALLEENAEFSLCPPEFAARIFSPDDSKFVSDTDSPQLQKLFRSERKAVALLWVQQTSAAVQRTMGEHRQIARSSPDLEFATEMKLAFLYVELTLLCGVLFACIRVAGPFWLGRLALYADAHSQRLAQVEQSFKAATSPRELNGPGALL